MTFYFKNDEANNEEELLVALKNMSDEEYASHVSADKNDFFNWVKFLGNNDLAERIKGNISKDEMIKKISSFFVEESVPTESKEVKEVAPSVSEKKKNESEEKPLSASFQETNVNKKDSSQKTKDSSKLKEAAEKKDEKELVSASNDSKENNKGTSGVNEKAKGCSFNIKDFLSGAVLGFVLAVLLFLLL